MYPNRLLQCLTPAVLIVAFALTANTLSADKLKESEAALEKAESDLDSAYHEILKAITRSDTRENLVEAQRAWLAFRDAEAELLTSLHNKGGIVYAHGRTLKQTELTRRRIEELVAIKKELTKVR